MNQAYQQSLANGATYATEHVFEWQLVGGFFEYVARLQGNTRYPNPNPATAGTVGFGPYWKELWGWNVRAEDAQRFVLTGFGSTARTPFEHIAAQYPSDTFRVQELVILNADLNGIKERVSVVPFGQCHVLILVFSQIMTGASAYDYEDTHLEIQQGGVQVRQVMIKLKNVLGTQKYMQETRQIYVDQANRMRAVIVALDQQLALPANRRLVGNTLRRPWVTMGLGRLWDQYMRQIWRSTKELADFMDAFYPSVKSRFCKNAAQINSYNPGQPRADPNLAQLCRQVAAFNPEYLRYRGALNFPPGLP
jgi:hypothetical protein